MMFTSKTKSEIHVSSTQMQIYIDAIVETQERLEILMYAKYQQLLFDINSYKFHQVVAKFCAFISFEIIYCFFWVCLWVYNIML